MSNLLVNWWRSCQFSNALKKGNTRLAEQLLQEIQVSGARLSWLEKLFRDKLQSAQNIYQRKREILTLGEQLKQALQTIEDLEYKIKSYQNDNCVLKPDRHLVDFIANSFNLIECDEHKLQCTGIYQLIFDDFEANLVEYLRQEFKRFSTARLKIALKNAYEDIDKLKSGQDPDYNLELTPHVYFMKYFLNNVYGSYLAWSIIYKSGLLPTNINILDIAAGPGTVAYGLALLLKSISSYFDEVNAAPSGSQRFEFVDMPKMHISYYSLEERAAFQYRGLQFWRRYIESHQIAINAYFRFDTTNIFDYCEQPKKIPKDFFDFIVISHCFFSEKDSRLKSFKAFGEIFSYGLKATGHVLLIIQGKKLFKAYNIRQSEDCNQEKTVIENFIEELGLKMSWYRYLTSTGRRVSMSSGFAKYADENLPPQKYMLELIQQYFEVKHGFNYALDDYIILARKN